MIRRPMLILNWAFLLAMATSCGDARANESLPDDGLDDRAAIQAELDRIAADGGGTLQLESGVYDVSGPIFMRSGVTLAGRGAETLLTSVKFNSRSDWLGVVVFAGTLAPGSYDDNGGVGYAGVPVAPTGERNVALTRCSGSLPPGLAGEVVWLSSEDGFEANRGFARHEYGMMNTVEAVDGCSLRLSDPVGIPAGYSIRLHWSDGSRTLPENLGEPNRAIRNAGVKDLSLETANSSAMLVTGCYRCQFTGLTIQRSRRLFSVQGTRFSLFENIGGRFTERGIEVTMFASENVVRNVRASYQGGTVRRPRAAIRFGEYARNNQLSDIVLQLGPGYSGLDKIRFDESAGNRLERVRLVVPGNDNRRLLVYRPPGASRARVGQLPPGTALEDVALCLGTAEDTCELAR